MEKQKVNFDFLSGTLSVIIGIVYGILAYNIKRSPMGNPLAPSLFPLILAAGMVIFGVMLLIKSDLQATKRAFEKIKTTKTANDILSNKMIIATIVASVVYALIFEHLGYIISTILFIGFILTITNGRKWVKNLIISVVFSIAVYYIFNNLLGIVLPGIPFINL